MHRLARWLLYLGSAAGVLGAGWLHAARIGHYRYLPSSRFSWSLAYVAVTSLAAYGLGLPELARSRRAAVLSALGATTTAAVGVSVLQLLAGSPLLPRFVVLGVPVVLVPWYVFCTRLAYGGRERQELRDRVMAVVSRAEAETLRADLALWPERAATVVRAMTPEEAVSDRPGVTPLIDAVRATGATVVVLDRTAQADDAVVAQAAVLHETGTRVRTLSLFYDEWLGKLPLPELERVGLMFDIGEIHQARYGRLKRILDVAVALVAGVVGVVLLPAVLAGNAFGNRGPLLYRQPRVGKNGRRFEVLKFRTMRPGAGPELGGGIGEWTEIGDPRVTPFGRWMRRTHVDELPQVWNILRGDLSMVGPRPEQPRYVEELTEKIPFYDLRHRVRPGLTGWAQVKYPYGASELDAMEKLQLDFYYLRHQSLTLDVRILGRTVRSVLRRAGR